MLATERESLRHEIAGLAEKYEHKRDGLMPILETIQERYRCISDFAMQEVARQLGVFPAEVYGVVSFYSYLSTEPKGRFVVRLCRTLSCDFAGKREVARQLQNELGIRFGETTRDRLFTLEYCNCLGMCDHGPAMLVNDDVYTLVHPELVSEIIDRYRRTFGPAHQHATEMRHG
ncbi:NADH-quinone oxidoreductase subunit NuoE [candidate division WOR-3 bacterium]|nr:NADH-quinone oxidoreductase subunit NuoE [candidate division WOR-3 bacterium]